MKDYRICCHIAQFKRICIAGDEQIYPDIYYISRIGIFRHFILDMEHFDSFSNKQFSDFVRVEKRQTSDWVEQIFNLIKRWQGEQHTGGHYKYYCV